MFGEDVKNVLLQHKSWITGTVLDQFTRGKLDDLRYPMWLYNESSDKNASSKGNLCNTCIVFVVGGVTFAEAKEVANISNQLI